MTRQPWYIIGAMIRGDRKDAWLMDDYVRGQHGLRAHHRSSRKVLNAMRDGDKRDAQIMIEIVNSNTST